MVKVIVTIFRARVRRAIVGRIPLATRAFSQTVLVATDSSCCSAADHTYYASSAGVRFLFPESIQLFALSDKLCRTM
jgi:hypothetical protein